MYTIKEGHLAKEPRPPKHFRKGITVSNPQPCGLDFDRRDKMGGDLDSMCFFLRSLSKMLYPQMKHVHEIFTPRTL